MSDIYLKSTIHAGPSMAPALKTFDIPQVIPYDGGKIRRGDVILFLSPRGDGEKIIHRVISVDTQGIRTRGDYNINADPWILKPDRILGRVVFVQRGSKRIHIYGGGMGYLYATVVRMIHLIDTGICFLLKPLYYWIARKGLFMRWLPPRLKTRILSFNRPAGKELQLLMGRYVIGRYHPATRQWYIRRPFRLFVDESSLPKPK